MLYRQKDVWQEHERLMTEMEQTLVSIVIPCYNAEKYLEQCLDSICSQTYKNLEIICVDDGSTDCTCKIIKERMLADSRILLLRQQNMFAGTARNYGMSKATGEYICFLDADDYFESSMIEQLFQSAQLYNSDIVLCDAYFLDDKSGEITRPPWVLNHKVLSRCNQAFSYRDIPDSIFDVSWGVVWNKLYKREFIERYKLHFQNIKRHNDEYFVSVSLVLAERISCVYSRLIYYRRNIDTSLQSYAGGEEKEYSFYSALRAIKEDLIGRDIYSMVKTAFLDKCLCGCLDVLERQKTLYGFKKIYNFLKHTAFTELGISSCMPTKHPEALMKYNMIKRESVEEYLFQRAFTSRPVEPKYIFPYKLAGNNRKIAIYAAGKVGREYYKQLIDSDYYCVVAWFDKDYKKKQERGLPVVSSEKIKDYQFDKIVVAVEKMELFMEIKQELLALGIVEECII